MTSPHCATHTNLRASSLHVPVYVQDASNELVRDTPSGRRSMRLRTEDSIFLEEQRAQKDLTRIRRKIGHAQWKKASSERCKTATRYSVRLGSSEKFGQSDAVAEGTSPPAASVPKSSPLSTPVSPRAAAYERAVTAPSTVESHASSSIPPSTRSPSSSKALPLPSSFSSLPPPWSPSSSSSASPSPLSPPTPSSSSPLTAPQQSPTSATSPSLPVSPLIADASVAQTPTSPRSLRLSQKSMNTSAGLAMMASGATEISLPLKGFLEVCRKKNEWKTYWCVLDSDFMRCYKKQGDDRPHFELNTAHMHARLIVTNSLRCSDPFFELLTKERGTIMLSHSSMANLASWQNLINLITHQDHASGKRALGSKKLFRLGRQAASNSKGSSAGWSKGGGAIGSSVSSSSFPSSSSSSAAPPSSQSSTLVPSTSSPSSTATASLEELGIARLLERRNAILGKPRVTMKAIPPDVMISPKDEYDHKSLKQSLDVALLTPPVRSDGVDATPYLVAPLTRNTSITSLGTCASFEASASAYCLPSSASRTMHWDQLSWGATSISDSSDEEEAYSDAEGEEQESDGGPAEKDGEKGRNTKGERQSGVASTSTKDVKRTNSDSATATTPSYLPPWFNSVGSGDCRDGDLIATSDSDEDVLDDCTHVSVGDWNERFQRIMARVATFEPNTPVGDVLATKLSLIGLAQDFIFSATSYGKIIISEVFLDDNMKTIKPVEIGGIAGGSKYIVHNILFKFALDNEGLFGGDNAAAAKVAGELLMEHLIIGHDLKGLQAYASCDVPELSLPIMALVDYRGFRLIAMSILPISKNTIVYGSNDGGHTVHNDSLKFSAIMERCAKILNLAPHPAGVDAAARRTLHTASDVEGHIGLDNRYYMIDFSRTFPPEVPDTNIRCGHLYRLLRPELVKLYKEPLSSDAYSNFSDSSKNEDVFLATQKLRFNVVRQFAANMEEIVFAHKEGLTEFRLTEEIHRRGINIRHLGLLLTSLLKLEPTASKQVCTFLVVAEMFARVIKDSLKKRLRNRMERLRLPLEDPYRQLTTHYLNFVFGNWPRSDRYWTKGLLRKVEIKFSGFSDAWKTLHKDGCSNVKKAVTTLPDASSGKWLVLSRVGQLMGIKFTSLAVKELSSSPKRFEMPFPVGILDIEQVGERIKHMNIVTEAEGYVMMIAAIQCRATDPARSSSFLHMAVKKFEDVLNSNTHNKVALRTTAHALILLDAEHKRVHRVSKYRDRIDDYLLRSIQVDPTDPETLFRYAKFLESDGQADMAEDYFLQSLECDPNFSDALRAYGRFLERKGEFDMAEKFFLRSCPLMVEENSIATDTKKPMQELFGTTSV